MLYPNYAAMQSQSTVSADFTNEQILTFAFAKQYKQLLLFAFAVYTCIIGCPDAWSPPLAVSIERICGDATGTYPGNYSQFPRGWQHGALWCLLGLNLSLPLDGVPTLAQHEVGVSCLLGGQWGFSGWVHCPHINHGEDVDGISGSIVIINDI